MSTKKPVDLPPGMEWLRQPDADKIIERINAIPATGPAPWDIPDGSLAAAIAGPVPSAVSPAGDLLPCRKCSAPLAPPRGGGSHRCPSCGTRNGEPPGEALAFAALCQLAERIDPAIGPKQRRACQEARDDLAAALRDRESMRARIAELEARPMAGIYIASKTKHAPRWRALRTAGTPIVSTWIDEAGDGETSDWADLWDRCLHEATTCAAMVVYVEEGEVHKGSLVEVGAALHAGVPVFWVGPEYSTAPRHRNVRRCADVAEAIACARAVIRSSVTSAKVGA